MIRCPNVDVLSSKLSDDTWLATSTRIARSFRILFFCIPPCQLNKITLDKRRIDVRRVMWLCSSSSPCPSVSTKKTQPPSLTWCFTFAIWTPFVHTSPSLDVLKTLSLMRQFMRNDLPCLAGPRMVAKFRNLHEATSKSWRNFGVEIWSVSLFRAIQEKHFASVLPFVPSALFYGKNIIVLNYVFISLNFSIHISSVLLPY